MDDNEHTKVLLLTANVGSIFEEPDKMLPIWLKEFLSAISRIQPEFVAIHCQEVGGKNYEETMQHVNKFIKMLLASEEMAQFDRARVFLDEDFTAVEKFTALGSLYFVHRCVKIVEIFDFYDKKFVPVEGKEVLSGNIEHVHIKEKSKFPQDFFPDFVWSRKGFIRTRWNLNNTLFDLVNIHLFHDISNLAAMEKSPSTYSSHRERALMHTVERFETDEYDKVPFFIFGDFNFRMDTNRLVKELTLKTTEERIKGKKNDVSAVLFKQEDDEKVVLKVGKKDFHHFNHNDVFSCDKAMSLMKYDAEPNSCRSKLFEYPVTFPPSYPFSENVEEGTTYMPTRCPGWCDRIMMSHSALPLVLNVDGETPEYVMIGKNTCMGDHKPIMLNLKILNNSTPGMNEVTCSSPVSGNVSVVVGHDNDLQINGTTTPTTNLNHLADDESNRNVISINGQVVVASDLNDINIHKNIKFELDELVTNKFRQVLMREQGNRGDLAIGPTVVQPPPSYSSGPLAPTTTTTTKVKPSLSFRNVVNNVLKSDSILRYMKRFKHRSDSESDDDDDDDDQQQQQQQQVSKSTEVLANSVACASPASNAIEADDDDDDDVLCENTNNNNNNNSNFVVANSDAVAATNSSSSPRNKNNKKKKRCTIQ